MSDLTTNPGLSPEHFTDERINDVCQGDPLTPVEREYLLDSLPSFEECDSDREDLKQLSDSDLMQAAYWTWRDYAGNQGLI